MVRQKRREGALCTRQADIKLHAPLPGSAVLGLAIPQMVVTLCWVLAADGTASPPM